MNLTHWSIETPTLHPWEIAGKLTFGQCYFPALSLVIRGALAVKLLTLSSWVLHNVHL